LRPGEKILNHSDAPWTSPWDVSINLPGSIQMGYLAGFIRRFEWWNLYPAQQLLIEQPGNETYNKFVSVVKSLDNNTILLYLPVKLQVKIRKPLDTTYNVRWFDPVRNEYSNGKAVDDGTIITVTSPHEGDMLLILEKE